MFTPILCYLILIYTLPCSFAVNSVESEDDSVIDLSHLGSRLYGRPKIVVQQARVLSENFGNPEEKGPYLEGDLLVPRTFARNGVKNEALKWKGGEVPYVISGRFSELAN
jgi:hypothetical protein